MPTYSYYCNDCSINFDYLVLGQNDIPHCPQCSGNNLKKKPTTFGTISDDTRFDTGASDLPGMNEFHSKKDKPPKKLDRNEIFKDF